ncbi:10935_t:CDS:1, partial [Racocetra persica]
QLSTRPNTSSKEPNSTLQQLPSLHQDNTKQQQSLTDNIHQSSQQSQQANDQNLTADQ